MNVVLARKKRFCSNVLFFAAPDAIRHFSVVNVNSTSSISRIKLTSISSSFEQLYLEEYCASVSSLTFGLLKHFKPRSPWKKMIRTTPACATWCTRRRICGWSYWLSISSSTMIFRLCRLSLTLFCFGWLTIYISQSTCFRCGKIFNDSLIENCQYSVSVKDF